MYLFSIRRIGYTSTDYEAILRKTIGFAATLPVS